jgi:DNA polymerase III sliding clamp (beta) subunit (PCNA family)
LVAAQTTGGPITLHVNGAFLLAALKAMPGPHVALGLNGALLPLRVSDPDHPAFVAVVMPMKIPA